MAIQIQGTATTSDTNSISKPTGTTVGEVLIAFIHADGNNAITLTDFTEAVTITSLVQRYSALYRVVTGSEGSTFTVSSTAHAAAIVRFSGVDTASPIHASAGQSGSSSATHTAPSVNTTIADTWLLRAYASQNAFGTWSAVSGYTQHFQFSSISTSLALTAFGKLQVGTGSAGAQNATGPDATWCGLTVALQPTSSVTTVRRVGWVGI